MIFCFKLWEGKKLFQAESLMCNSLTLTMSCIECYSVLLLEQYIVCCTITCCWPHVLLYVFHLCICSTLKKKKKINTQSVSWRECCFCKVFVKKNLYIYMFLISNFAPLALHSCKLSAFCICIRCLTFLSPSLQSYKSYLHFINK